MTKPYMPPPQPSEIIHVKAWELVEYVEKEAPKVFLKIEGKFPGGKEFTLEHLSEIKPSQLPLLSDEETNLVRGVSAQRNMMLLDKDEITNTEFVNRQNRAQNQAQRDLWKNMGWRCKVVTKVAEKTNRYTYRVTWSEEDKEYVGLCAEFPSLSWLDDTQEAALRGINNVVVDVISDMESNDEAIPEPISLKNYSGNFTVRIPFVENKEVKE